MYLPTIDLYELGQYIRIVLWIYLPLTIISLLVTTWFHYRRGLPDQGRLRLSMEGSDNAVEDADDPLSYHELSYHERDPDGREEPVREEPDDRWGKENESVSEWKGKDNIYQGILWMKEKYEQYRDKADQRYELLKEAFNLSERRYQDLLLSMEENKGTADITAMAALEARYSEARQQLDARQLIIDELEGQLEIERLKKEELGLKVEELAAKLQSNSQLLLNIYQELDKTLPVKETE